MSSGDAYTVVGVVQGHFGVKGWVKVLSFTRPTTEILDFARWGFVKKSRADRGVSSSRQQQADTVNHCDVEFPLAEGRWHGKGLIARIGDFSSREAAEELIGATIVVHKDQFAEATDGEFYWSDLVGLDVVNMHGSSIGHVDHLVETGANDVLVIRGEGEDGQPGETLIPWSDLYVRKVDLEKGQMMVDWDAD